MFSNCDDAQQVTKEKARFMLESNEEVCCKSFRNNEYRRCTYKKEYDGS